MNAMNRPGDEDEVIVIDETNSVTTGPGPASEDSRKMIRAHLAKEKRLLELRDKMYGKPEQGEKDATQDRIEPPPAKEG